MLNSERRFLRAATNAELEARYPALNGGVVTERHARICRERGHALWTLDGKDTGICPRCGDVKGASK